MAITSNGLPVESLLTSDGIPVFRIGTSTNGLTAFGEPVFGLSTTFNAAFNAAANTIIQPGAPTG